QKVHGTSKGSVYYLVARNARVRVAARIYKAGSISIRAEWQEATPDELEKLKAAGLVMKAEYASLHLDPAGVPASRIIGAFVMGTGIEWQEVVKSGAELVVENS
ncbi:MAG: hypothetical protein C5B54_10195, partial [Acidobacteria bacterium]